MMVWKGMVMMEGNEEMGCWGKDVRMMMRSGKDVEGRWMRRVRRGTSSGCTQQTQTMV